MTDHIDAGDRALADFVHRHPNLFVLTGAGCSTESGLGDYRDTQGQWKRRRPITGQTFVADEAARKRYWARSSVGWPAFSRAQPGIAHQALAAMQKSSLLSHLVTQNVDQLHQKAGHRDVVDLHGVLATVSCITCQASQSRDDFQVRLLHANPWLTLLTAAHAPDGDADLELEPLVQMNIPACENCGGLLKPDVVFFGENVARNTVVGAMDQLRAADALLVAGSSLMVFSGFRFARDAALRGQPIVIVNHGKTRADDLATLKIDGDVGVRLQRLATT
jgi:NAD-dependent SIR2 family protein deacetylase